MEKISLFSGPQPAGHCGDIPVYRYGYTDILGAPPDLTDETEVQRGNTAEIKKIALKRSKDLRSNCLGSTTPRMPRTQENDDLRLECGHLIDGDPETCWCSNPQFQPDVEPAWIRIDLPVERSLNRVVIRKREGRIRRGNYGWRPAPNAAEIGCGIPEFLTVKISRDGRNWTTVFDGPTENTPERTVFEYGFDELRGKQILVTGRNLPHVENLLCCFSVAGVGVFDVKGREVSLASYGSAVSVSSSMHTFAQTRECHHWFWPLQYEMGLKWARIGYHDDPINWHQVEREKGVLKVDPEADAAIDDLLENGVEVVMALGFGNRLYTDSPERILPQMHEWNYEMPKPPSSPEAIAAWARYIEFMVKKYAGRIRIFEVWNEWNIGDYWGSEPDCALFIRLSEIAFEIIRRCAPDAKIMMGSAAGFPFGIARWKPEEAEAKIEADITLRAFRHLARKIDMTGWHPFYQRSPESAEFKGYEEDVKALKKLGASFGFGGRYFISEYSYFASYPYPSKPHFGDDLYISEIVKAKILAGMSVKHTELDMPLFYCETWNTVFPADLSLMRRIFSSYPIVPTQPEPAFYVLRNLANILDGFRAAPGEIASVTAEGLSSAFLTDGTDDMIAFWQKGCPKDEEDELFAAIKPNDTYASAAAYDPVNGTCRELDLCGGELKDIRVKDYPVLIKLKRR